MSSDEATCHKMRPLTEDNMRRTMEFVSNRSSPSSSSSADITYCFNNSPSHHDSLHSENFHNTSGLQDAISQKSNDAFQLSVSITSSLVIPQNIFCVNWLIIPTLTNSSDGKG